MNQDFVANGVSMEERSSELLFELEKMFKGDPKCEARHEGQIPDCSVEVSHTFHDCLGSLLICSNTAEYVADGLRVPGACCKECTCLTVDCWSVRPI